MHNENILIVDDAPANLTVLSNYLQEAGFKTIIAQSGSEAIRYAETASPDLILLDVSMPEIDGFETCRHLKANDATRAIPVIFMIPAADHIVKFEAFEAGGVDYVNKPCEGIELLARVNTHLELRRLQRELEQTNQELQRCCSTLEEVEHTDPLTQLLNRRNMMAKLEYEKIRFERNRQPFALVLGDIDNFKGFNETFGHECGDFILKTVADTMRTMIRKQDHLARWGGEEFLFLLPDTGLQGGAVIAEKIRQAIATRTYTYLGLKFSLTMTFGVNVFEGEKDIDACLKATEGALQEGKSCGKNCLILA